MPFLGFLSFVIPAVISGAIGAGVSIGLENMHSVPSATNTHQSTSPFGYLPSNGGGGWVTGGR
ncbi:TPA: hypothetical protein QCY71_005780 [Bacillus cereus]|nr:hypothetical protein [Bacillus cereus]